MSGAKNLEEIVSFSKRRGFVYQTSEVYGGLANSYDLGPLGVELMRRIKDLWWREFITKRPDMVGLDSQILLHPQTWVASGHVDSFTDPLVEDKVTHKRYRADHLIEDWLKKLTTSDPTTQELRGAGKPQAASFKDLVVEDMNTAQMAEFIREHNIKSPDGNPVTEPKDFNILFETSIGSVAGEKSVVYMRGETAQGIFTNFKNVIDTTRVQLPFGIGQIGKSFRNEITTGQFVFRTLEFEQAEIEYFFDPKTTNWQDLLESWRQAMWHFVTQILGIKQENVAWRRHTDKERSHYSQDTYDLDYQFPFGWKELWGVAYRTDYDLKQHIEHSGKKLDYTNPHSGEKIVPHVIEPALGLNRALLMVLCDSLTEIEGRTVLQLKPELAPYKVAVFPLLANKPELVAKARSLFDKLIETQAVAWDSRGNIGKRYASQDEIGTPYCVTIDFETLENDTVTVRDRDTAKQERVALTKLDDYLKQ